MRLGVTSEPEPDIAVLAGPASAHRQHPTTAMLLIEVSESSLPFDRSEKLPLYSRAGISDFWIVNLQNRQLEVYRNPQSDGTYAPPTILTPGQSVSPLAMPTASVAVADLLP